MDLGASNLTNISTKLAPPPTTRVNQSSQQGNQNAQTARQAALSQATANTPAAPAVANAVAAPGSAPQTSAGGTTTPSQSGARFSGAQTASQTATGTVAMAMANAFSATFMAATGAIAMVSNRKRVSDVSGDAKEGDGTVEAETESEAQPDALVDAEQEMGAGEITQAGQTSGPST